MSVSDIKTAPHFMLRRYWVQGLITDKEYLTELNRRDEASSNERVITQKLARYGGMIYAYDECIEFMDETLGIRPESYDLIVQRRNAFQRQIDHLKEQLNVD